MSEESTLYRKARKLVLDPKAFVLDSAGWRTAARILPFLPAPKARRPGARGGKESLLTSGLLVAGAGAAFAEQVADSQEPVVAFIPWIDSHTTALATHLSAAPSSFRLLPFELLRNMNSAPSRLVVSRFARSSPDVYRRLLFRELLPLRGKVAAMMFTFDWHPAMRIPVQVCRELGILTILVPHEGVFMDRERYYLHEPSGAASPITDQVLCWGKMQHDIFRERGYPVERMSIVGAPKFDAHTRYEPTIDRETFFRVWGLDERRKTILFAAQPLDIQADPTVAHAAQVAVISDLLKYCADSGCNLIVRTPPADTQVLPGSLLRELEDSPDAVLDSAGAYIFAPLEMMHHTDVTVAINSTMLFEACLLGRRAIAANYFDFQSFWEPLKLPVAADEQSLRECLNRALADTGSTLDANAKAWAEQEFALGVFDGRATERVVSALATTLDQVRPRDPALQRLLRREDDGALTVGFPHLNAHGTIHRYVGEMLHANVRSLPNVSAAYACDVIAQWGALPTDSKRRARALANRMGRPVIYLEDGFIRSLDIGLKGEAGLSLFVDDLAAYYDATQPSRLELRLQGDEEVPALEIARARAAIARLVHARVSKYNHAPDVPLSLGTPGRPKVLVLDQRRGDASVTFGLADDACFETQLEAARSAHPDKDILIKRHPDATRGGMESYYASTAQLAALPNVVLVDADANPYRLFELVEEVYTVTSGMGFEALLAGKRVHCFGMPFYAGWGLTHDAIGCERRTRKRSIEEVFYFAYLSACRYYHPRWGRVCELEDLIDYIADVKTR